MFGGCLISGGPINGEQDSASDPRNGSMGNDGPDGLGRRSIERILWKGVVPRVGVREAILRIVVTGELSCRD
jgi:hypothetical protein